MPQEEGKCSNNESCIKHLNVEDRVKKLEEIVEEIRLELKQKAVTDAQITKTLELVLQTMQCTQQDVSELRTNMMSLVTDTLNKSREDMATYIKMQEKNDEKDREHKRLLEQKELDFQRQLATQQSKATLKDSSEEKSFYRKLIIACVSVGGTIVLATFGISKIIPIFLK
jgi:cation transport ATPase